MSYSVLSPAVNILPPPPPQMTNSTALLLSLTSGSFALLGGWAGPEGGELLGNTGNFRLPTRHSNSKKIPLEGIF
jgi:hypothetical protein